MRGGGGRARLGAVWVVTCAAVVTVTLADEPPPDPAPAHDAEEPALAEKIVVSASATGGTRIDAPAAVDVLDSDDLEARPADSIADQLRRVPGINVVQFSARDVNIASRQASGGINNSTIALADGRTLYQDFLGFVMWEFAPTDPDLVERIEVVRGPASALWGANAVGGVVHVIGKSPRDTPGGKIDLAAGSDELARFAVRQSVVGETWAVRGSARFEQVDAFDRPETITNFFGETIDPDLGLIDGFEDSSTSQPRVDLRADREGPGGSRFSLQGGWGRTAGWIATGLGPFAIDSTTGSSWAQARFERGTFETQVNASVFDGAGRNLINAIDFGFTSTQVQARVQGRAPFARRGVVGWGGELERSTYDLTIAPEGERRTKAALFGAVDAELVPRLWANVGLRVDHFAETIGSALSPRAALRFKPRPEQTLRLAWGRAFRSPSVIESDLDVPLIPVALLDWESIDQQLIERGLLDEGDFPEGFLALMARGVCAETPDNCGVDPGETPTYVAVTAARGSRELDEEVTSSFEIGYAAQLGRLALGATVYATRSRGGIDFPQKRSYGSGPDGKPGTADDLLLPPDPDADGISEAPPIDVCGFGLELFNQPVDFTSLCARGPVPYNAAISYLLDGFVPALFQYDNGARVENRGVELGLGWEARAGWSVWINGSWQDEPEADGVPMDERIDLAVRERRAGEDLDGDGVVADTSSFVNVPAVRRLSAGAQLDRRRWTAAVTVDHVSETFWQDVLTSDFWGWVDGYTLVGLRTARRFPARGLELTGQATNLFDEEVRQHVYGDVIDLRATVGLSYTWAGPPPVER